MRIEISDNDFHKMLLEVCENLPSDSITFQILADKVKRMSEHELYSFAHDPTKTVEERNKALFEYYESKMIPERFRGYIKGDTNGKDTQTNS